MFSDGKAGPLFDDLPQAFQLGQIDIAHTAAANAKQVIVLAQRAVKMVAAVRHADLADGAALCQTSEIAVHGAQADIRTLTAHGLVHSLGRGMLCSTA